MQSVKVASVEELAEESARRLQVRKCRMVSGDGRLIASFGDLKDPITAVAQDLDPLLQLVGLQNADGELAIDSLSRQELKDMALEIAVSIARVACWFGGPQHLAGLPRIQSLSSVAPKLFRKLCVDRSTPVVPAGTRVVLSVQDEATSFPAVQVMQAPCDLTVQDIMSIRDAHEHDCQCRKAHLLSMHPGADSVDALMRLVRYTSEEVHFELGHRVYKLGV